MAATQVRLDVVIEPGGAAFTVAELRALLPDLLLDVAPALERSAVRFAGRIEVTGEDSEVSRVVARHLGTLRQFSRQWPSTSITISEPPDGGELRLQGGSFGADEDEVTSLLAAIAGEQHWRLYLSFRIEADAHAHLRQLVERALPVGGAPVFEASDAALAIGFDIDGGAERVADFIAIARLAWRQEGSEAECLVEVEGPHPIVEVARTWSQWVELEQRLRSSAAARARGQAAPGPATPAASMVELAHVPEAAELLGDSWLTWVDADDQIIGICRGVMYALPERTEAASVTGHAYLRRTSGGELIFVRGDERMAVPPAAGGSERRVHKVLAAGALLTDTAGTARATTQPFLATARGIDKGPPLSHVRALDVSDTEVFALAAGRTGPALIQMQLGHGWGYAETRPWHPDETATDLAVVSVGRIAIIAERGSRSTLYLVERANLVYARRIMVPCVGGQIVAHSMGSIWITGMSPAPGPARCDLFRVDVMTGTVVLVTAELEMKTIDEVATNVADADGPLLLLSDRAVHATSGHDVREVLELAGDEAVTGMACGTPSAVFIQTPRGSSVILGRRDVTIALPTAAFEPQLSDRPF